MNLCNKARQNKPLFSKQLEGRFTSKATLLKSLSQLFGCVYLENHGDPVIGVLPTSYCIHTNDVFHNFNRDDDLNYIKNTFNTAFEDFVTFEPTFNNEEDLRFKGGYLGFIDYNFASNVEVHTEKKPQPNAYIGRYESYLKLVNNQWIFISYEAEAEKIYNILEKIINQTPDQKFKLKTRCTNRWSKQEYLDAFHQVQDYIRAGDCYQINLTQEFSAKSEGDLIDTAEDFWKLTDAPYSGYLKLNDFELLSCSPELFINFEKNRKITTRPIKGTMPRFEDSQQDQQSKDALIHSEKDQAENLMIVDLLRNDLSVYAETGSVKTPKLFEIESFKQVHHMVSEVTATLKPDVNPFDVLMSALPGGSITGAPKIRAMQIIEELEGSPRGAYCGSMGYFNFNGTGSWNILIRSIQKYQDDVSIWAGGGITIASDADAEYQECFDKVEAMMDLLNTWYEPE